MVIVAQTAYIAKRTPKMIRGMVMAYIGVLNCLGTIVYLQTSKWATTNIGRNMCFGSIAFYDIIVLTFILIAIAMGKFGHDANVPDDADSDASDVPHNMELTKNNTHKNRTSRNLDGYYNDFDLPEFDVYDEVMEVSEDREASSRASMGLIRSKKFDEDLKEDLLSSRRSRKASKVLDSDLRRKPRVKGMSAREQRPVGVGATRRTQTINTSENLAYAPVRPNRAVDNDEATKRGTLPGQVETGINLHG